MDQILDVEAYSGFKGKESPRRYRLGDRQYEVLTVRQSWHDEQISGRRRIYFRVVVRGGEEHVVYWSCDDDAWYLKSIFPAPIPIPTPAPKR